MESQLEEMRRKINELLAKRGFYTGATIGAHINPSQPDRIQVQSQRDDIQINISIGYFEPNWTLTDESVDRTHPPHTFKDKEDVLEFIDNKLQELVKCCG